VAARFGPRRALLIWLALFPPVLWALAATGSLPLAIGLFLAQGIVPAATNPLIDQLLLERVTPDRHGAVSSARNAATEVSGLAGASLGGKVLEAFSFGGLFVLAGCVAAVGAVGLGGWLARSQRSDPSDTLPRSSRQTRSA
jgi:predicted MFS family arabinose efflux permease